MLQKSILENVNYNFITSESKQLEIHFYILHIFKCERQNYCRRFQCRKNKHLRHDVLNTIKYFTHFLSLRATSHLFTQPCTSLFPLFLSLPFNYCYRTAQHAVECSESHLKVCLYISSQDDTGREPWQSIPTHPCVYMCMLTVFIHTTHTAYILCLCQKLQK